MVRTAIIGGAALFSIALAGGSAAAGTGAPGVTKARPSLQAVRLVECSRGKDAADRLAVFRGAMRRVSATRQMWMRFRLQERVGDGRYRTVKAGGLGVWRKSRPRVRRFSYRQRVLALAQGATYRAVVSFRWHGEDGTLLRRVTRRSPPCRQHGDLANLRVTRIEGGRPIAGIPGAVGYRVRVVNRGPVAAGRSGVALAVDGGTVDTQALAGLAPGEARHVSFVGPPCMATVTARADPEDAVRESRERDNALTSACPTG